MGEENKERGSARGTINAPFIFGVSGHRDLVRTDLPELRKQLHTVFSHFCSAYPNASFELLSPLAEGADRVAAEVALASGIRLAVPMPMAQADYERDFTGAESLSEFRRLLATANSQWELSSDQPKQLAFSDSNRRTQRYAAVGDFIARASHVLILLWDGRDNQKVGGTAWVKKRREHWVRLAEMQGAAPEVFGYLGTIHIVTPRETAAVTDRPRIEIFGQLPALG